MSRILHRSLRHTPPRAAGGEGIVLRDTHGRSYLDASGGAAVSSLGHGHPDVIAALHRQIDRCAYAHTAFFTTDVAEELAERLVASAPAGIGGVYLVSGGSEAVETALKLARQYFVEAGEPGRTLFIARRQSYHGNTLGALAAGGNEWRRAQFAPLLVETSHVSPCYEYRGRAEDESLEAYGLRVADELEAEIRRLGPETVMAFVAEPVVGATAGAVPAVPGYLKRVREICDRHGVLLILDEVMCGMGRTGHLFACAEDGVAPDMITIAKGLGAGYQPIGALLVQGRIYDAIAAGSGFFQHGHTYMGHAMAAAAANAVLDEIEGRDLLQAVRRQGARLEALLQERLGQHPHVGDIRGRGLFRGIELVADRETKEPFDPARKLHARIKAEAFAGGLICYPMGGTLDGVRGDHILLAPPFIISDAELDELVDKLSGALDRALAA